MKKTELRRKTPLESRSELRRQVPMKRTTVRAVVHARETHRPKRLTARNTGPTAKVRALVAARSQGWCEWSGCWLTAAEIHHRLNRKQGGRRGDAATRINQAAWLLHACRLHHDLVTSPHGEARTLAHESGWLLLEHEDARTTPVLSRHGRVLLADDGTTTPAKPEEAF